MLLHVAAMATKLFLKPQCLSFTYFPPKSLLFKTPSSPKLHLFCLTTTSATATGDQSPCLTQSQFPEPSSISYGPSLHKGSKPPECPTNPKPEEDEEEEDHLLDEGSLTRVFDISALRVPSKHCFALENRIRWHLLNWPRIRNIARVPGDEVDPELAELLGRDPNSTEHDDDDGEEGRLVSLQRRIYGKAEGDGEVLSPVLYRDKLARTFNSRGYAKFRNLAKISRPKKRKKREAGNAERKRGIGKNEFALVEVVEDGEEEGEDFKNLLGDEFKRKTWRGSTRLLLLDERYAGKGMEELPEAIKVAVPTLCEFIGVLHMLFHVMLRSV